MSKRVRIPCLHHALTLVVMVIAGRANGQIVINELEYDESGNDTAEFIELFEADLTGMSLTGWQLILYNGTGSARAPYLTVNLNQAPGGVMPADGYLVIGTSPAVPNVDIHIPAATTGWIQNGAPDGMALVHNGVVVELLAYEGSFMGNTDGTGGPAAGMMFQDIGVEDDTASFVTLQRVPGGSTWVETPDTTATPGRLNNVTGLVAVARLVLMHRGDPDSGPIELCAGGGAAPYIFTITALPTSGQLSHDSGVIGSAPTQVAGELRYTSSPGFSGLDAFSFYVRDAAATISNPVTEEVAVQAGGVVISEVMYHPTGDNRVFEFVEIHNLGASSVGLRRLDASRSNLEDTTDNLDGHSISPGQTRIVASDPIAIGIDPNVFRCEWSLREEDIIRVPEANLETMYSQPDPACAVSEGSRLLLFNDAGELLDAVDLALSDLLFFQSGQSLTIHDGLLIPGGPLDTRKNDVADPWQPAAAPGVPGVRVSQRGDWGGPMIVPSLAGAYTSVDCFGRCCQPEGVCQDLSQGDCAASGGDVEAWVEGTTCGFGPEDRAPFISCLTGPAGGVGPGCDAWDQDPDGRVDLRDAAEFQVGFTEAACP